MPVCRQKKIGAFDDFVKKRVEQEANRIIATTNHNQKLTDEEIQDAWDIFKIMHGEL